MFLSNGSVTQFANRLFSRKGQLNRHTRYRPARNRMKHCHAALFPNKAHWTFSTVTGPFPKFCFPRRAGGLPRALRVQVQNAWLWPFLVCVASRFVPTLVHWEGSLTAERHTTPRITPFQVALHGPSTEMRPKRDLTGHTRGHNVTSE